MGSRREGGGSSRLAGSLAFGEESAGFFGGVGFAALGLSEAYVEALIDGVTVAEQPVLCCFFGFEEVERVGDDFGRLAEAATVEFAPDAGFGGGIEGQTHG